MHPCSNFPFLLIPAPIKTDLDSRLTNLGDILLRAAMSTAESQQIDGRLGIQSRTRGLLHKPKMKNASLVVE